MGLRHRPASLRRDKSMCAHKKTAVYTPRREPLEETSPVNTLILNLEPPELRKCISGVRAPPAYGFVTAAQAKPLDVENLNTDCIQCFRSTENIFSNNL